MTATTQGRVSWWDVSAGWGVIDSVSTPGGCFVHFSALPGSGFRELRAGAVVEFTFEITLGQQDGYGYRAVSVDPSTERFSDDESTSPRQTDDEEAYSSTLELTLDDDGTAGPR